VIATGLVTETLRFRVNGASQDAVATTLQSLHAMQEYALWWRSNAPASEPVWLWVQLEGETNQRRAFVYRIEMQFDVSWWDAMALQWMTEVVVSIERGVWEATANSGEATGNSLNSLGGVFDYTASPSADVPGDLPARLAQLKIYNSVFGTFWAGFRSANRHGTLANFVNRWECEAASALQTDAALAVNANASPGTGNSQVTVSFATSTSLVSRLYWLLSAISTNYNDMVGRYLVLLRCQNSDAATVNRVQLVTTTLTGREVYGPKRSVIEGGTGSTWQLVNLGILNIPLHDRRLTSFLAADAIRNQSINLYAQRVSGSGSLYLDCMMLVPIDEYFIYGSPNGTTNYFVVGPDGRAQCLGTSTVGTAYVRQAAALEQQSAIELGVPLGDGRLYIVAGDYDYTTRRHTHIPGSIPDTSLSAALQYVARWHSLRGSG
jgi:hypothetical protein